MSKLEELQAAADEAGTVAYNAYANWQNKNQNQLDAVRALGDHKEHLRIMATGAKSAIDAVGAK